MRPSTRPGTPQFVIAVMVALSLVAAACGSSTSDGGSSSTTVGAIAGTSSDDTAPDANQPDANQPDTSQPDTGAGDPAEDETDATTVASTDGSCAGPVGDSVPWDDAASAQTVRLIETGEVTVDAVIYPRPDYDGRPWSQWGQGIVLADGRFLSAIGDHLGRNGNSYLYEFDPGSGRLTQIADALSLTPHVDGDWGYGKIHAQMVAGPCNDVLVTTYWGSRRDLSFTDTYRGDVLFRLDPSDRTIQNLGVLVEAHGVPSLAASADGLLYAEALDPLGPPGQPVGQFVAVDPQTGETVFRDDDPSHVGYRSIAVDDAGRAYYSVGGGQLSVYDPATNASTSFAAPMPGDFLRAVTPPTSDGAIVAVTQDPAVFFRLDPSGSITELADAQGYTTSIALSPDETSVYYVPDAHGGSWQLGTPLIAVDTTSGAQRTIVELNDAAEATLGLRLGGTYSVATHGDTIYIGMNAGDPGGRGEAFGEVVLLIVNPA